MTKKQWKVIGKYTGWLIVTAAVNKAINNEIEKVIDEFFEEEKEGFSEFEENKIRIMK